MTTATINSYCPSSLFAGPLASLLFAGSLSVSDTYKIKRKKTFLIYEITNKITPLIRFQYENVGYLK
jgi:hypothetical protein